MRVSVLFSHLGGFRACLGPSVIGDVISVEKTVKRCLLDTFKHTDEEFLKQASSQ